METGALPKKDFRVMTIKMIKKPGRRKNAQMRSLQVLKKELENTKNNQTEGKRTSSRPQKRRQSRAAGVTATEEKEECREWGQFKGCVGQHHVL